MLTILGKKTGRFCDGVSRRAFLQIGALSLGGMSLPEILRAEAASGVGSTHKGIINILTIPKETNTLNPWKTHCH